MEYPDGETLAQRVTRGKLPLDQAIQYGIHIADALAAAHKAGIVHRDLKPGNVMLTKSGAKLLDFGLGKPGIQMVGLGRTELATQGPLSGAGIPLGTLHYMAPEQIAAYPLTPAQMCSPSGASCTKWLPASRRLPRTGTPWAAAWPGRPSRVPEVHRISNFQVVWGVGVKRITRGGLG